jgi:hypothetical protein
MENAVPVMDDLRKRRVQAAGWLQHTLFGSAPAARQTPLWTGSLAVICARCRRRMQLVTAQRVDDTDLGSVVQIWRCAGCGEETQLG